MILTIDKNTYQGDAVTIIIRLHTLYSKSDTFELKGEIITFQRLLHEVAKEVNIEVKYIQL